MCYINYLLTESEVCTGNFVTICSVAAHDLCVISTLSNPHIIKACFEEVDINARYSFAFLTNNGKRNSTSQVSQIFSYIKFSVDFMPLLVCIRTITGASQCFQLRFH